MLRWPIKFFDILKENTAIKVYNNLYDYRKKVIKGVRRMPRLSEAMKDVTSCDKLRVGANNLLSGDFRMGQPGWLKASHPDLSGGKPRELKHLSTWRTRKQ